MGKWILAFVALLVAGCGSNVTGAPFAQMTPSAPAESPTTTITMAGTPESRATPIESTETPTSPNRTAGPTLATTSTPALTPQSFSTPAGLATTVSSAGWKTYVNTKWHVAVDYPPDWAVRPGTGAVTFRSPRGAEIELAPVDTGGESPEDFLGNSDLPNTRCASQTNPQGITARVCLDTISFSTIAQFIMKAANGTQSLLSLVTNRRTGDLAVLNAMLASVRSAP